MPRARSLAGLYTFRAGSEAELKTNNTRSIATVDIGKEDRSEVEMKVYSLLQEETKSQERLDLLDTAAALTPRPKIFRS